MARDAEHLPAHQLGGDGGSAGILRCPTTVISSSGQPATQSRVEGSTRCAWSVGQKTGPAMTRAERVETELNFRHHAEVTPASAHAPEQVGVLLFAGLRTPRRLP